MVRFLDGPATDVMLTLRRAPLFLRVVINAAGKVDALDQLEDQPAADEFVHVYRKDPKGRSGRFHVRPGGCFEMGDYYYVAHAPSEELRDTTAWRRWVDRTAAEEGLLVP